ncbi:MAG: 5'/3'-nucleotidase SurE [Phocaeicola sp.]
MRKPLILISNDDGVTAKGINELIACLRDVAELVVVAPHTARSGYSGAITCDLPVHYSLVKEREGLVVYKCTGTPVDCIKLALQSVTPRRPDLVIGGINHGDNSGINVHYSGTMAIAIEAALKGVPAIGFSLCNHHADADFSPLFPYIRKIVAQVLERGIPAGTCLNVNFPKGELVGLKVCRQAKAVWSNEWAESVHPRGGSYFWLTGDLTSIDEVTEGSDFSALQEGYATITPTQVDMTAYHLLEEMKKWDLEV